MRNMDGLLHFRGTNCLSPVHQENARALGGCALEIREVGQGAVQSLSCDLARNHESLQPADNLYCLQPPPYNNAVDSLTENRMASPTQVEREQERESFAETALRLSGK